MGKYSNLSINAGLFHCHAWLPEGPIRFVLVWLVLGDVWPSIAIKSLEVQYSHPTNKIQQISCVSIFNHNYCSFNTYHITHTYVYNIYIYTIIYTRYLFCFALQRIASFLTQERLIGIKGHHHVETASKAKPLKDIDETAITHCQRCTWNDVYSEYLAIPSTQGTSDVGEPIINLPFFGMIVITNFFRDFGEAWLMALPCFTTLSFITVDHQDQKNNGGLRPQESRVRCRESAKLGLESLRKTELRDPAEMGVENPLVLTNSLPWYRWPIEIDGLPILEMVIFHG